MVLLPIPKNSYALEWQDLWQSKDQQAQKNFNKQQFGQAATQFDNPEWKAAAHYKAGEFTQAAESLQSIQTTDALYNRGNALAKSGQLQEALQAYQQALAIDPKHQDTLHNKALVEEQLEKKQQENDQQQKGDNQSSEQDSKSQQQKESEQEQENAEQSQKDKGDQQQPQEQKSEQQDAEKPENEKQQAEQNPQQKQNENKPEDQAQTKPKQAMQQDETQQANEQWLQRIPDDPSGLLKRKFKYQYGKRKSVSESAQTW